MSSESSPAKVFIASDHAGFELKQKLLSALAMDSSIAVTDLGPREGTSKVDYPNYAAQVCKDLVDLLLKPDVAQHQVSEDAMSPTAGRRVHTVDTTGSAKMQTVVTQDALDSGVFGILICGSGQGMAMAANKSHPLIRAALCLNPEMAQAARSHNNANVLCMGQRWTDIESAKTIVYEFLKTPYEGGRHNARIEKLGLAMLASKT